MRYEGSPRENAIIEDITEKLRRLDYDSLMTLQRMLNFRERLQSRFRRHISINEAMYEMLFLGVGETYWEEE